jgi:transaldolase
MGLSPQSPHIGALNKVGQSIWYDNLSRDLLRSGELKRYIELGVSGLTSNPTIFQKAIGESADYDDAIRNLVPHYLGNDSKSDSSSASTSATIAEDICEDLFVEDVGAACDLLHSVYVNTSGADGYASLEVSPELAHDAEGTVAAAERLWKRLSRPNAMIKVPATPAGIVAIERLLAQGINVNVTLIFSSSVYGQVMDAYLSALEQRVARGESISGIASVASFFVSRVDAAVEKDLSSRGRSDVLVEVLGKVGIANSRLAYHRFLETFHGDRWSALERLGARVQRPLWASTGTKNPAFSKLLYVEALARNMTVNTVPPQTLDAILEGVQVAGLGGEGLEEASRVMGMLSGAGVDFERILGELQVAGVAAFSESYAQLLGAIAAKIEKMKG